MYSTEYFLYVWQSFIDYWGMPQNMIGSTLCRMIFKWNSNDIYLNVMLIFIQSVILLQYRVIMEGEYETCYITEYNTEVSSVLCDDFKNKSHESTQTVRTVV